MNFLLILSLMSAPASAQETKVKKTVTERRETVTVKKTHAVVVANTLWAMAKFYYEDPWQWPRIYEANKDRIKDPHWIYPGQEFIIPGLDKMVTVVSQDEFDESQRPERPVVAPQVAQAPELQPEAKVDYEAAYIGNIDSLADSLSVEIPEQQTGQAPAMYRFRLPKTWKEDGKVVEFGGREAMAATGDVVSVKIAETIDVRKGSRFTLFRKSGLTEADRDPKGGFIEGTYVQKVGIVEILRKLEGGSYRARVLAAGGSVALGDLLKAGE